MRQLAKANADRLKNMPMNKYLLGEEQTDTSKKIAAFMNSDYDKVQEVMRWIKIAYSQIMLSRGRMKKLQQEIDSGKFESMIVEGEKNYRIIVCKEEAIGEIAREEVKILGSVADIRNRITHKLLPMITGDEFTKEHYEQYFNHVESVLKAEGYTLIPTEYELMPLCKK